jgi:hypothetical protein
MVTTSLGRPAGARHRASAPRFLTSDHWFTTGDGTPLFYRAWRPSAPAGKILVLFHRGHEHSGRWDDVIEALPPDEDFQAAAISAQLRDDVAALARAPHNDIPWGRSSSAGSHWE